MKLTRRQLRKLISETKFMTKGDSEAPSYNLRDINASRNKKLNDALDGPLGFAGLIMELGRQGLVAVENIGLIILDKELQEKIENIYEQDGFSAALDFTMRHVHEVE